ncbi:MAG TPA: hypothetical protein DHU63_01380 [Candidatus Marinimicrobia bacterium]|nr:MAG: hypothetical protein AUJ47_06690 [Candidatus Marinimicrobia bacterium CG1_02_48_14]HCW75170.1 hypothetical protein [Candidatus Neomarinimicrobiota bacterium]
MTHTIDKKNNQAKRPKRILIIDDDKNQQRLLRQMLKNLDYDVVGVLGSGAAAVEQWANFNPDLILMDIIMETPDAGIEAGKKIGSQTTLPIIYLTASEDTAALNRALTTNPQGYLVKPVTPPALKAAIEVSFVRYKYEKQMMDYREALERSEQLFRGIFTNLQIGYFRVRPSMTIVLMNPFLAQLLDVPPGEELIGRNLRDIVASDLHPHAFLPLTGSDAHEMTWKLSSGVLLPVKIYSWPVINSKNGEIVYLEGTVEDMTRSNIIRDQLIHAQKMKVISMLSGRVAHEINNSLTSVLGHAELIISKVEPESKINKYANSVVKNSRRASNIITQLLSFSREWPENEYSFDLVKQVLNMLDLIRHLIGSSIELIMEMPDYPLEVLGNPRAFEQALLNIAMNARDAMPEGGVFTIKLEKAYQDGTDALPKTVPAGIYAQLILIDSGVGMTQNVKKHLFDPFFTTKEQDISTGLGLSVVQRIVHKMNGHIFVESEPGQGAQFQLLFPVL